MKKILLLLGAFTLIAACEKQNADAGQKEVTLTGKEQMTLDTDNTAAEVQPQYEQLENMPKLPAAHTLDTVQLTEFIDFGCGYCYKFSSILADIQNLFREKLKVVTYVVPWRGETVVKAYYYADLKGKGEEFKGMMFRLFHDSNIKNINNPDIIRTVLSEIKLIKDSEVDLDTLLDTPEITKKFKAGNDKMRQISVKGTPTVLIEDAVKAEWTKENLTALINYLLK